MKLMAGRDADHVPGFNADWGGTVDGALESCERLLEVKGASWSPLQVAVAAPEHQLVWWVPAGTLSPPPVQSWRVYLGLPLKHDETSCSSRDLWKIWGPVGQQRLWDGWDGVHLGLALPWFSVSLYIRDTWARERSSVYSSTSWLFTLIPWRRIVLLLADWT